MRETADKVACIKQERLLGCNADHFDARGQLSIQIYTPAVP